MELPVETVTKAVQLAREFVCVNLAPACPVPAEALERADLLVANDLEAAFYGPSLHAGKGLVAITHGAKGASLFVGGQPIASVAPPRVRAVDTTGAGDAFVAALTVALVEGMPRERALAFACAAGAVAATRPGAQSSLPMRAEVEALLQG